MFPGLASLASQIREEFVLSIPKATRGLEKRIDDTGTKGEAVVNNEPTEKQA
jgi:hypothetical protein